MTKNSLTPPNNKTPLEEMSVNQLKQHVGTTMTPEADPSRVLKQFAKLATQHDGDTKNIDSELTKAYALAVSVMSLNTHARLADTTTTKLAPLAITVAKQLIDEYGCETAAERTLAETVASAYVRTLRYAEALNDVYSQGSTTPTINRYIEVTGKELDRANRQYLTALAMLKNFHQPGVNVTFKANTAFVAQNQEVNAVPVPTQKVEGKTNEVQ
jgi:hypothetical protein